MNKFNNSYLEETAGKCKNTRLWKNNPFSNFLLSIDGCLCTHKSNIFFIKVLLLPVFLGNIEIEGFYSH